MYTTQNKGAAQGSDNETVYDGDEVVLQAGPAPPFVRSVPSRYTTVPVQYNTHSTDSATAPSTFSRTSDVRSEPSPRPPPFPSRSSRPATLNPSCNEHAASDSSLEHPNHVLTDAHPLVVLFLHLIPSTTPARGLSLPSSQIRARNALLPPPPPPNREDNRPSRCWTTLLHPPMLPHSDSCDHEHLYTLGKEKKGCKPKKGVDAADGVSDSEVAPDCAVPVFVLDADKDRDWLKREQEACLKLWTRGQINALLGVNLTDMGAEYVFALAALSVAFKYNHPKHFTFWGSVSGPRTARRVQNVSNTNAPIRSSTAWPGLTEGLWIITGAHVEQFAKHMPYKDQHAGDNRKEVRSCRKPSPSFTPNTEKNAEAASHDSPADVPLASSTHTPLDAPVSVATHEVSLNRETSTATDSPPTTAANIVTTEISSGPSSQPKKKKKRAPFLTVRKGRGHGRSAAGPLKSDDVHPSETEKRVAAVLASYLKPSSSSVRPPNPACSSSIDDAEAANIMLGFAMSMPSNPLRSASGTSSPALSSTSTLITSPSPSPSPTLIPKPSKPSKPASNTKDTPPTRRSKRLSTNATGSCAPPVQNEERDEEEDAASASAASRSSSMDTLVGNGTVDDVKIGSLDVKRETIETAEMVCGGAATDDMVVDVVTVDVEATPKRAKATRGTKRKRQAEGEDEHEHEGEAEERPKVPLRSSTRTRRPSTKSLEVTATPAVPAQRSTRSKREAKAAESPRKRAKRAA
ncbi:hypothetical protein EW026_g7092 [Hermanssonia centrifuga]|uniref:Uncharacterized protein n=1 Tax=Hermanssonia centrifuga TaxID=98765 RepID=A0A4S4K9Z5_9APHY|nr:hypothetical protein EW026_g7092 [Hermanssonia centrifuga]